MILSFMCYKHQVRIHLPDEKSYLFWYLVSYCSVFNENFCLTITSWQQHIHGIYIYIYIHMLSWKQCTLPIIFIMMYIMYQLPQVHELPQTIHNVPKCMSCCKAIVVITRRPHCFHYNIWDLSTLCVVNHLWLNIYYIHVVISKKLSAPTA